MITIEEAILANDKVIAICLVTFVALSFVAWVCTIRRERKMNRRIKKAVEKAVTKAQEDTRAECNEKALVNFIRWMDASIELKKVRRERDELKRKYAILRQAAEGCPGVTAGRIKN